MIIALLGTLLGLVIGVVFAWAMVRALRDQGIDKFSLAPVQLLVIVVLAAVFGVVAAAWPARRAAKLDVLDSIQSEASRVARGFTETFRCRWRRAGDGRRRFIAARGAIPTAQGTRPRRETRPVRVDGPPTCTEGVPTGGSPPGAPPGRADLFRRSAGPDARRGSRRIRA